MVWAQDYSNGAYDDVFFARTLVDLNTKYPAAGTDFAAQKATQWYSALFYWPMNTPLPPLGNAKLTGVIAGQLNDPWTPYSWTQEMRRNFPQATLLTSRSSSHGLHRANDLKGGLEGRCIANYQRYLRDGYVDFVDGTVCASDVALGSCSLLQVFTGDRC